MVDMTDLRYPIGTFTPPGAFIPQLRGQFIEQIAEAPSRLRAAADHLSLSQLRQPYRDGGWTVAQVVHHLVDSHMNAYVRFKLAVTEPEPTIKPYNEALWAQLPDATNPDIVTSLQLLESMHERWVVFLRSLDATQFQKTFRHPDRGIVTLDWTLALYAWHGRHHVAHITSLRSRMGW